MASNNWEQIAADFRQKYEGTFIRASFKEGMPLSVYKVTKVVDGAPPQLRLSNEEWGELRVNYDTELEINFDFPEVGYFFFDNKYAMLLTKQFYRQWKRGLCKSTVLFANPYNEFFSLVDSSVREELVISSFMPRTILPIKVANNCLDTGEAISIPLSNSFALGLHLKPSKLKLLWFLNMPIGEYNLETNQIILHAAQMEQEIKDYLNQTGDSCAILR